MKRFKFPLERLLKVRQQREQARRQDLAAIQRDIERGQVILERLDFFKDDTLDELRNRSLQGSLDIPGVIDCHYRLQVIAEHIKSKKAVIAALREEEAVERQGVITARRDKKVVENLKGRAYARYLEEGARLEQRLLDEIGIVQYMKEGGDDVNERSVLD